MKLQKLIFSNLGGFTTSTELDFSNFGMVLLDGKTGSGKSSILDTVSWVLYDETLRGVKKSDWVNLSSSKGKATLFLLDIKDTYKIEREREREGSGTLRIFKNDVDISEKTIQETQTKLEKSVLCTSFSVFRNSSMFGQRDLLTLAEGTDKERKDIIGEILGFEEIDACLNETRKRITLEKISSDKLEASKKEKELFLQSLKEVDYDILKGKRDLLVSAQEEVEKLKTEVENLKVVLDSFSQYDRLKGVKRSLREKCLKLKELESSIIPEEVVELDKTHSQTKTKLDKGKALCATLQANIIVSKSALSSIEIKIEKIISLTEAVCPTCFQPLDESHEKEILSSFETERTQIKTRLEAETKNLQTASDEANSVISSLTDLEKKITSFKKTQSDSVLLEREITLLEQEEESLTSNLPVLKEPLNKEELTSTYVSSKTQLSSKEKEAATLLGEISSAMKELEMKDRIEGQLAKVNEELKAKLFQQNHLSYLEELFSLKGVRNRVLEQVFPFMENEINEYLSVLFPSAVVSISTIKEGKTVAQKQELTFNITDVFTKETQDFKLWSGGQKMLISLALRFALWKTTYLFSKRKIEALFLDEVFGCLDEFYREVVFTFLEKKQQELQIPIVVAEHLPDVKEEFNQVIEIGRVDNVSKILKLKGGSE